MKRIVCLLSPCESVYIGEFRGTFIHTPFDGLYRTVDYDENGYPVYEFAKFRLVFQPRPPGYWEIIDFSENSIGEMWDFTEPSGHRPTSGHTWNHFEPGPPSNVQIYTNVPITCVNAPTASPSIAITTPAPSVVEPCPRYFIKLSET